MSDNDYSEQAQDILVTRGLTTSTAPDEMSANIGRDVRFKDWQPSLGTLRRDFSFRIVGTQLTWDGKIAYRVTCNGYNDTFGSVARPEDVEFVEDPAHPDICSDCGKRTRLNALGYKVCVSKRCFSRDTRETGGGNDQSADLKHFTSKDAKGS